MKFILGRRFLDRLRGFWLESGDPLPLDLFRRGLGVIALAQAFAFLLQAEQWFGAHGWISESTAQGRSQVLHFLATFGFDGVQFWIPVLLWMGAASFGMILGIFPWVSSIGCFLAIELIYLRNPLIMNGADRTIRLLIFILCFFRWSRRSGRVDVPLWPAKLVQVQICIAYASTFIHKLVYEGSWTGGYAVRLMFTWPQYAWFSPPSWFLRSNMPEVTTYFTLLVELLLGVLVFLPRRFLIPVLLSGIALHLGIAVFTVIPYFSAIMVVSYLVFFRGEELRQMKTFGRKYLFNRWGWTPILLLSMVLLGTGCSAPVNQSRLRLEIEAVARTGRIDLLRSLVSRVQPIDLVAQGVHEQNATAGAAESGSWELVTYLQSLNYRMDGATSDGNTMLHHAASQGRADWIPKLVKMGIGINLRNHAGSTPLHLAAFSGRVDAALALLNEGANLEIQNSYKETPLHVAVWQGQRPVVALFIERGANINAQAEKGETSLHYALTRKQREIFDRLKKHKANDGLVDQAGVSARGLALKMGLTSWFQKH